MNTDPPAGPGDPAAAGPAEVVVAVLSYNDPDELRGCLRSLADAAAALDPAKVVQRVLVVDNASSPGTLDGLDAVCSGLAVLPLRRNVGYAGGAARARRWVERHAPQARYLALLNQDLRVEPGWLEPVVAHLDAQPGVSAAQPVVCFEPRRGVINTAGNRSHFLGFGTVTRCGEPAEAVSRDTPPYTVDFCSGAAVVIRRAAIDRAGLFEPRLFMYLEDAELGWRHRLAGYRHAVVPAARVYHREPPGLPLGFYYHLERNRWWLLLVYYRWRTLILLAPALGVMELAQLVFAAAIGRPGDKLRAWGYFARPAVWRRLRAARREARALRTIPDRAWVGRFAAALDLPQINRGPVRWLFNPLLAGYWAVARRLMFW